MQNSVWEAFRYIQPYIKVYRRYYVAGLFFLVLTDLSSVFIPRLIGGAIDIISHSTSSEKTVASLMLKVCGLACLIMIGRYGWRSCIIGSARRIGDKLRRKLYSHFLSLSPAFFQNHKVGDMMARATNDIESINMMTGMAFVSLIDGIFMTVFILVSLFSQYGTLGMLIVTPLPLISILALTVGRSFGSMIREVQEKFARISEYVQESLQGVRIIKSFVQEEQVLRRFSAINKDYASANMAVIRFWGVLFPSLSFIGGVTVVLLLYFGGLQVLQNKLSPGDFVVILSYLGMLLWPAMQVGWVVNMSQRGKASIQRVKYVLDETPEIQDAPGALSSVENGNLVFASLNFSYDGNNQILKNIDFTALRGFSTGLLGRTGSGKTTLVRLLSRLYNPPAGSIFIGNTDIKEIQLELLRRTIIVVPQDIFLFSTSIKDNLLFGVESASEDEINRVVNLSALSADLHLFPDGLETRVGERGLNISGGQKQRIAIGRALLTKPEILILDDPLSAVDAHTEEHILENIFRDRQGKTTLLISHRISALSRCDYCTVIDDGIVSAFGTPSELGNRSGLYRDTKLLQKMEKNLDNA